MNPDILRWDKKYSAAETQDFSQVDGLLKTHAALLSGHGRALDVACGAGANAIHAAALGYATVGVDGSVEGLRIAARRAHERQLNVQFVNADLDRYRPPPDAFDLVMVFRYLNRSLYLPLERTLRPGGLIFFKTFNQNFLKSNPGFNPDYVLRPGELARAFAALDQLDTNDTAEVQESLSWWVGRKPVT